MKILQINNVYGEKSTGKITKELHEGLLQAGHESLVVYGRGKGTGDPGVIRLCPDWYGKANSLLSRLTGLRYGGCLLSTWYLQRIILREKPDVVHLQCINEHFLNIYRLIAWLKKQKIRTVLSLHAEFMYTANCGYAFECDRWKHGCGQCPDKYKATKSWFFDRTGASWRRMKAAFEGFEENCLICPVSPWTEERSKQSDILGNFQHRTVLNGVNTQSLFCRAPDYRSDCRNTVLNVTSWFSTEKDDIKGGWHLVRLAERMPEVTFWVAGRIESTENIPDNITLLGEIRDQKELAEKYRQASLSVLVSRKETFSMPCAESLCCGTPMVGFKAGAPEQICIPEYSTFVEQGDIDALQAVIREWLARENTDRNKIAEAADRKYSIRTMIDTFIEIYRSLL